MKDCGRVFALLSEYLDRELPAGDCGQLEEHLQGCPECIQFVESLRRSVQLCGRYGASWTPPQIEPEAMTKLRGAYEQMLARRRGKG